LRPIRRTRATTHHHDRLRNSCPQVLPFSVSG
jgi:hypothetical protein